VARKHIREIEQYIQTIKGPSGVLVSDLPYIIHLVYFAVLWLNSLPVAARVYEYSPCKIIFGSKLDFKKHCKTTFGSYFEAHDDPTITNTMRFRTFPGIFLGLTGKCQGTHKVFNINTGLFKEPYTISSLPMIDRVIKVVKDLDKHHQKEDKANTFEFLNQKRQQYNWDKNDLKDDEGLDELNIAHPNIPAKLPSINLESEQPHHHQVIQIIEESYDKHVYAAQCNASLDDLPHKTPGVSIDADKVDTFKIPTDNPDPFHKPPILPILLVPLEMMMDDDAKDPVNDEEAAEIEDAVFGSTTVDGLCCSTQIPLPAYVTKVSFNNKLYSNGTRKDSTVLITVGAGHQNDHPSPITQIRTCMFWVWQCFTILTPTLSKPPLPNPTVLKPGSRNLVK
jgi:hypothetical protein